MKTAAKVLGITGIVLVVGAIVLFQLLVPPAALERPPQGFLISNVTLVVPGENGRREAKREIRGRNARIASIESADASAAGPYFGMYVLPGLTDAHVHFPPSSIPGQTELFAFLMLYHGITSVRDAADLDGSSSLPARDGVARGSFPGPRIFSCGPFVDGDPPRWANSIAVSSPEEGRAAVRKVAAEGFDCIKAYNELETDELDAIREEAQRRGLAVIGHVPRRVPYEEALLDDAQHLIGVPPTLPGKALAYPFNLRAWLEIDDARRDFIIELARSQGLSNTPTLITIDRLLASRDYAAVSQLPEMRLLPRFYRAVIWNPKMGISAAGRMQPEDFEMVKAAQQQIFRTVKRMHEAGAELHTGTDTLTAWVVPGKGLHRELRLLNRAGISADEVMKLTSVVSARHLDSAGLGLGRLEVGAPAELVVFREDPTQSLDALDTIAAVVRDGRLYTREALDAQLARYQQHFEGAVYDALLTPVVRRVLESTRSGASD